MKLTKQAIKKIDTRDIRLLLGLKLGFSERWISECISVNKNNGPLTTVAALKVIQETTGLTENEILTEDKAVKAA